jgi:hypothetical protein
VGYPGGRFEVDSPFDHVLRHHNRHASGIVNVIGLMELGPEGAGLDLALVLVDELAK